MIAKTVAWLLVLLCAVPVTAPFSVPSAPFGKGHRLGASVDKDVVAPSLADDDGDDAVPVERSTSLNECGDCAVVTHAIVADLSTSLVQELSAAVPPLGPQVRAVVLRV
jgi:hypothetical protein